MPFRDLREFMSHLEEQKEFRRIRKPVDIKYEIAAYIRKTSDIKGPALLFENVNDSKVPVLGGVFATRKRALLALETSEKECAEKVSSRPRAFNSAAKDLFRTVQRGGFKIRGSGFVTLPDSDFFTERFGSVYYRRISH